MKIFLFLLNLIYRRKKNGFPKSFPNWILYQILSCLQQKKMYLEKEILTKRKKRETPFVRKTSIQKFIDYSSLLDFHHLCSQSIKLQQPIVHITFASFSYHLFTAFFYFYSFPSTLYSLFVGLWIHGVGVFGFEPIYMYIKYK